MSPYFLLFLIPVFFSFNRVKHPNPTIFWIPIFIIFSLFVGFRTEVGGDWFTYLRHYELAGLYGYFGRLEPGYQFLNIVSSELAGGIYLVNLMCASIFFYGLIALCRSQPLPLLAFIVSIPYMIVVTSMGYTRQSVALGFFMLGLVSLSKGKGYHYFLYISLATLFHKVAILLYILLALYRGKVDFFKLFLISFFSAVFVFFLFREEFIHLFSFYILRSFGLEIGNAPSSAGGIFRLFMNLIPSLLLIIFYKKMRDRWDDINIWLVLSIITILLIPLIGVLSTVIDRVSVFLLPLQVVVMSRFPVLFSRSGGSDLIIKLIILFYGITLAIWLNYANHAGSWLPYRFL
jgi:hypothetical protein